MTDRLLLSVEVAELLQVHPKQIYRLLARGLPGRRIGREWRFDRSEVLKWVESGAAPAAPTTAHPVTAAGLVAANGDVVVELLLARSNATGPPLLGFIQADRDGALDLLRRGQVLLAGCHGKEPPRLFGDTRLARIHLVVREVGLVGRPGASAPELALLPSARLAARPSTAGIRVHLEGPLQSTPEGRNALHNAQLFDSHRDVVHAVVRGDADVGLVTRAWAARLGLPFQSLATEHYGLVVRATELGDPRVVRVCEVAQSAAYRHALGQVPGYDARDAGAVQYHFG